MLLSTEYSAPTSLTLDCATSALAGASNALVFLGGFQTRRSRDRRAAQNQRRSGLQAQYLRIIQKETARLAPNGVSVERATVNTGICSCVPPPVGWRVNRRR